MSEFRPASRGFTLLEMIAVLGIIAVLAALLVPAWIKRIDLAVKRAERGHLVTISNALTAQVLRGTPLPSGTTWSQPVADWTMLPVSKVTANKRRYSRLYFVEQNANPAVGSIQTPQGVQNRPQHLRAMVVSILGGDALDNSNCPNPAGGPIDAASFNEIWNVADGARPSAGTWANWKGKGDDFLVQRINYAPLFHHLLLLNRDTNVQAAFTINGSAPEYIVRQANNLGRVAYYLDGTVVALCDPNGLPMTRYVLQQDISFVWEDGRWHADILGAPESDSVANDFGAKAKEFVEALRYDRAFRASNQQGVITAMNSFMLTFTFWANQCPLFTTHGVSHTAVSEYKILVDIGARNGRLDEFSRNLVRRTGGP